MADREYFHYTDHELASIFQAAMDGYYRHESTLQEVCPYLDEMRRRGLRKREVAQFANSIGLYVLPTSVSIPEVLPSLDRIKGRLIARKETMQSTSLFLPRPVMARLSAEAARYGTTQSELIRQGLAMLFEAIDAGAVDAEAKAEAGSAIVEGRAS